MAALEAVRFPLFFLKVRERIGSQPQPLGYLQNPQHNSVRLVPKQEAAHLLFILC